MSKVRLVQRIAPVDDRHEVSDTTSHVLVRTFGAPYMTACRLHIPIEITRSWPGEAEEATCPVCRPGGATARPER